MYLHIGTHNNYRFRNDGSEKILQSWGNRPHGHSLYYCAILRSALFVLAGRAAELAWLVALRSIAFHMGTFYLARLTEY